MHRNESRVERAVQLLLVAAVVLGSVAVTIVANAQDNVEALMDAAKKGSVQDADRLLKSGVDVNSVDPKTGGTAVMWAAFGGHKPLVAMLLDNGAKLGTKDKQGENALMWAVQEEGHLGVIDLLIEKGEDVNLVNLWGWTPLMRAAYNGHKDQVELLLKKGAQASHKDKDGFTALDWVNKVLAKPDDLRKVKDMLDKAGAKK